MRAHDWRSKQRTSTSVRAVDDIVETGKLPDAQGNALGSFCPLNWDEDMSVGKWEHVTLPECLGVIIVDAKKSSWILSDDQNVRRRVCLSHVRGQGRDVMILGLLVCEP